MSKLRQPIATFKDFSLKEPIVLITIGLIVLQSVVEASMKDGYTWQTLVLSGVTALMGVFMRQAVYSPATYERDVEAARKEPVVFSNDIPS